MRLWHYKLIPHLSRQRLLGQHRECCALRGKGWGKKHSTVDYVFTHSYFTLFMYHFLVMMEMVQRKYKVSEEWWFMNYRGKILGTSFDLLGDDMSENELIYYPEHNKKYLEECLALLKEKGEDLYEKFV